MQNRPKADPIYPLSGWCRDIGISRKTAYKWIERGELETFVVNGRRYVAAHEDRRIRQGKRAEAAANRAADEDGMMNLRKLARGKLCMVRIPGVCNFDPETTVLAHVRRGATGGMGIKPPDICGVWACSACHDAIDGRVRCIPETDGYVLDALVRTLTELDRLGAIK